MPIKVHDQSAEVSEMAKNWTIVETLLGGTAAMRSAGTSMLPKWPNEEQESYNARLATATLFPALGRTISVMGGKPFAKQAVLGDDVPENIALMCDNCDQQGNNFHTFLADVFNESLGYGLCGVLVDHPKSPDGTKTVADERALGMRPYMVFIRHNQILGWKAERKDGAMMLTQLRISECVELPDGLYGTIFKRRVRVLFPGGYEIWQEGNSKEDEWTLVEGGVTTLNVIPFIPFYGKKLGFMCGISPLMDLAYLNVKHWQSQSDQDTILHVARVPILAIIGAEQPAADGQGGTKITVGSKSAVLLPLNGDMKFVEHTGAAIDSGAKSLADLEAQMVTTGAELLVVKPGDAKSATQSNNDAEANKCDLQRMVESTEDGADQVLQLMALWTKQAEGGHISLFKDFGSGSLTDASAQLIQTLQQGGLITKKTAIQELQRRGTLSPDIDPDDELEAVAQDGPTLGTLNDPATEPAIDPATGEPTQKAEPAQVA